MRYGEALKFFFNDPNKVTNLLIGSIFMFIPILGPIAIAGWHAEIAQRLHRGETEIPVLSFNDLMTWFERGLVAFVAQLMATIPLFIGSFVFPLVMIPLTIMGAGDVGIVMLFVLMGALFFTLMGVLTMILVVSMQLRAELSEDFSTTLDFGAALKFAKMTWSKIIASHLIYGFLAFPLMLVGMLLCFVGIFPVAIAVNVGAVHLRVQIYHDYLARGGEEIPVRDPNQPRKPLF